MNSAAILEHHITGAMRSAERTVVAVRYFLVFVMHLRTCPDRSLIDHFRIQCLHDFSFRLRVEAREKRKGYAVPLRSAGPIDGVASCENFPKDCGKAPKNLCAGAQNGRK